VITARVRAVITQILGAKPERQLLKLIEEHL